MRLAYFGGDGMLLCLAALVADGHQVARVFAAPRGSRKLQARARKLGARVHVGKATRAQILALEHDGIDLLVSAGFRHIIPVQSGDVVRAINVHPSLLPFGRGSLPYPHVILEGHTQSGVTVHEMDAHFDTGPILYQDRFTLAANETARSLRARSRRTVASALRATLADFEALWQAREPQERGEFRKAIPGRERILNWNSPVEEIDRRVRALEILGVTATIAGEARSVLTAVALPGYEHTLPGEVLVRDRRGGFLVAAADGAVWVTTAALAKERSVLRRRLETAAGRLRRR